MTLEIELEKNLFLVSDTMQFMIRKYGKPSKNSKTGEMTESYSTIGHYGSIEETFRALMKKKMLSSGAKSFKELISVVEAYHVELKELLKPLEGHSFYD